jgi:segregation and condensation protein B
MDNDRLKSLIEAAIFASDHPITITRLMNILELETREEVKIAINALKEEYDCEERGIYIEEVAGGYQMRTKPVFAPWLRRLLKVSPNRLSRASMETLAIVSYKQPLTRYEVENIRGVDCGGVLRTLIEKGLIKIVGRKDTPGRPAVYGTTKVFLEIFELKDLSCLPNLNEIEETKEEDVTREITEDNSQGGNSLKAQSGKTD